MNVIIIVIMLRGTFNHTNSHSSNSHMFFIN